MPDSGQPRAVLSAAAVAARLTCRAAGVSLAAYIVVMVAEAAAPVAAAWFTKLLVDALVHGGSALMPGIVLAAVGVCVAVLPALSGLLNNVVGRKAALLATARLFEATGRQVGLARFEDPAFADRLRLAQQAAAGTGSLASAGFGAGRSVLMLGGFVGSLTVISPTLTVVVLLAAVPVLAAQLRLSRRRADLFLALGPTERRELFYAQLLTTVNAAKEIRLFGIGVFLRDRMLGERKTADAARLRLDLREGAVESGLGLLGAAVAGGGLLWAALAAARGHLGVGDVTVLLTAVASVQGGLYSLISSVASTHQSLLLFGHYVGVLRAQPDLPVAQPVRPLPALTRGIELRDVWFRYSENHPWILRGVNLFIAQGQSVALVGLNGAGKSTLVKLLCRFYDPSRGSIQWDGVDIRDVPVEALRARISCVFQDYMTYDMSAEENIAVGDIAGLGNRERIEAAARHAGIDRKLRSLPDAYDTLLTRMFFATRGGESAEGVVLSGGEWQRIALARAFMRDRCELVVLDEPSSGLDAEAEHEVHATMQKHRAGRTTLLISHRLNTVRDADLIVVLSDGQIAQRGTHQALLAGGGDYARLFQLQSAGFREEPGLAQAPAGLVQVPAP